jgi:hypothetical protein
MSENISTLPKVDFGTVSTAFLALITFWLCAKVFRWFRDRAVLLKQMPRAPNEKLIVGHAPLAVDPRSHIIIKDMADKLGPIYYFRILMFHVSMHIHCIQRIASRAVLLLHQEAVAIVNTRT